MFVKICGLSDETHVHAAVDAGADAIGFVLTDSPRRVAPELAYELAELVPRSLQTVAVFAGEPVQQILDVAAGTRADALQLHGGYSREDYAALAGKGYNLIRAVSGADETELDTGAWGEDLLLVDAPKAGSGHTWDLSAMKATPTGRWLLAGGLTPENVGEAIAKARPWGVDVSSGVESSRGVKDVDLITRFVVAAKAAAA